MVIEPNDSIGINMIIESRDAIFYEERFKTIPRLNDDIKKMNESSQKHKPIDPPETTEPRRSKQIRMEKSFGPDFIIYLVEGDRNSKCFQLSISPSIKADPQTFEEAMKSQDASFWKEAINDEMDSIIDNNT